MIDLFLQLPFQIQAALIAAITSLLTAFITIFIITFFHTPIRYFFDRLAVHYKLKIEYEYEQRKQLRNVIGKYHGRLLEAGENLNHRMWNLYQNEEKGWLDINGQYSNLDKKYYFKSTLYRFLRFYSLSQQFENESIFIDARIAENTDLIFLKYLKALDWVMTDAALFKDLNYNSFNSTDHFFHDYLRKMCEECCPNGEQLTFSKLEFLLKNNVALIDDALHFFDGLKYKEERFRWDRVVAMHLLLMTFINTFGYDMQKTSKEQFIQVAKRFKNAAVGKNMAEWLKKLGLGTHCEARNLFEVLTTNH